METILVTGGAGFIGSNFVRLALAELPTRVVVLDKLTYAGNLASLADVADHQGYVFVQGDIAERETVGEVFERFRPTAVLNFAAESHVDRSIDGPAVFVRTNVVGTFELLEAARHHVAKLDEAARQRFRFLHVSTDEVYGSLGDTGAFREDTPYAPNSPYAASKAGADHLVRAYHETYGLPALVTNCSNNYGPYQFPEKLIPLMILNAVERELPAADNPALAGRGIASYRDLKTFVPDRPGHDQRYAIDDSKVRREIGWEPEHGVEDGLAVTVRWYLDHRDWCDEVQSGKYRRERLGTAAVPGGTA